MIKNLIDLAAHFGVRSTDSLDHLCEAIADYPHNEFDAWLRLAKSNDYEQCNIDGNASIQYHNNAGAVWLESEIENEVFRSDTFDFPMHIEDFFDAFEYMNMIGDEIAADIENGNMTDSQAFDAWLSY